MWQAPQASPSEEPSVLQGLILDPRIEGLLLGSSTHECFNFICFDRYAARDHFTAFRCHDGIVLNANANVVKTLWHTWSRPDINARLNGQDHARSQNAAGSVLDQLPAQGVFALTEFANLRRLYLTTAVVHIHAKPMAGSVHVKLEIASIGDHILHSAHFVGI